MIRQGVLVAGLGAIAAPARAEPPPVFELSVTRAEGAGSCPSGNEFERRVSARLGRVPFTPHAEQAIETTLSRRDNAWRAEINLRDPDGIIVGQRAIDAVGEDCQPLAEAATLAIALTIDPDAALQPVPSQGDAPLAELPPPLAPPASACRAAACPSCPLLLCTDRVPPIRVAAALRGVLTGGLIPGPAPGVSLSAEAGPRRVRGVLGLLYLPETTSSDPRFSFGLTAVSAGVCAFPLPDELELGLCGEIQLGAIHAVVEEVQPLDPGDQFWFAAAAGPRLRLHGPGPSFLELGVSAVIPILDRSFEVDGLEEPIFEPATVGGIGFVGLGLHSP